MRKLPIWAKKPKSKKKVIATHKGWVVEDTGEVLKCLKGLDERLKALFEEIAELSISIEKNKIAKFESQEVSELPKPKTPVRRGRPKKNATKR
jgi:hypothetical protein